MLAEFSRTILNSIVNKQYEFVEIPENTILGILTLENLIERIMNMDISDEKDLERTLKQVDYTKTNFEGADLRTTSQVGKAMLGRGKSIKYDTEEDQRQLTKSFIFMQQFTATLERNLKLNMSTHNLVVSTDSLPARERHKSLSRQNTYEQEDGGGSPMGIKETGRQMSRSLVELDGDSTDQQAFNGRIQRVTLSGEL